MSKQEDASAQNQPTGPEVDSQAQEQTGRQQVRLRIDERNMTTNYANAFRTNAMAEEVMLDFGINLVVPNPQAQQGGQAGQQSGQQQPQADIVFQANNRLILNYYAAKRLAISLGQVVRRHEEQFGELKLNAAERMVNPPSQSGGQGGQGGGQ